MKNVKIITCNQYWLKNLRIYFFYILFIFSVCIYLLIIIMTNKHDVMLFIIHK